MIFGAILAGGTGNRINISDMPKQFFPLGSKPIIIHTLEKFLLCSRFDAVYLGVHPDWVLYMDDLVTKYIDPCHKIHIVAGGDDRNCTIMNIAHAIEMEYGENEEHFIVTHDAVRPFISLRILEENVDAVLRYDAVDTVIPATDTIVHSENGELITEIPNRKNMYQGQTPQSFRVKKIIALYQDLSREEKAILTDACKICVVRDEPVYMVKGDVSNFKITTVNDYEVAKAMVGGMRGD